MLNQNVATPVNNVNVRFGCSIPVAYALKNSSPLCLCHAVPNYVVPRVVLFVEGIEGARECLGRATGHGGFRP